jgi:hypothetical protein
MPRGKTISLGCGAALTLVLAAGQDVAAARIAVNRSIAGIALGMRAGEVRARLGAPQLTTTTSGLRDLVYRDRQLVVTLARARVVIVSTRSRHERTSRGIGPGSTSHAVAARLAGARCGAKAGVPFCRVGSIRPGRRSTTLQIEGGRVVTVTVARALR